MKLGKLSEYFSPFYRFRCHYPLITYLSVSHFISFIASMDVGKAWTINLYQTLFNKRKTKQFKKQKTLRTYMNYKHKNVDVHSFISKVSHHKFSAFCLETAQPFLNTVPAPKNLESKTLTLFLWQINLDNYSANKILLAKFRVM